MRGKIQALQRGTQTLMQPSETTSNAPLGKRQLVKHYACMQPSPTPSRMGLVRAGIFRTVISIG